MHFNKCFVFALSVSVSTQLHKEIGLWIIFLYMDAGGKFNFVCGVTYGTYSQCCLNHR